MKNFNFINNDDNRRHTPFDHKSIENTPEQLILRRIERCWHELEKANSTKNLKASYFWYKCLKENKEELADLQKGASH